MRLGLEMQFNFYQEVVLIEDLKHDASQGILGVIFGFGEDEGRGESYAVYFPSLERTLSVWGRQLKATGKFFKREDFYEN